MLNIVHHFHCQFGPSWALRSYPLYVLSGLPSIDAWTVLTGGGDHPSGSVQLDIVWL